MIPHIGLAVLTFMITNIDDLLILSMYFASSKFKTKNIVLGQYVGIATLIAVSFTGFLIGKILDQQWVSLLGLFPLLLGVKDLSALKAKDEGSEDNKEQIKETRFQFINVALVTIANGGDNIGVYAPLFANIELYLIFLYVTIFIFLTGIWCLLGFLITKHPGIKTIFSKHGKTILPVFLMALGLFILKDFIIWLFA